MRGPQGRQPAKTSSLEMSFVNNYSAPFPATTTLPDPNKPYDLNFCFPVRVLENEKLKLVPFVPRIHARAVFELIKQYPSVMRFMSIDPFPSLSQFEVHFESVVRSNSGTCLFVILDKAQLGSKTEIDPAAPQKGILGVINYCAASPTFSTIEIGFVIVFPPYQGTHVSTHAIGLMMQYALDTPDRGGLGVRRLQWQAHTSNVPSIKVAQRMGFKMEAIFRWHRPLAPGKESSAPFRADDSLGVPGRHSAMLSMCWDDWESGGGDHVLGLLKGQRFQ